jgi:hypothetical protein
MKSIGELDRLVSEVIMKEDFNKTHLSGFSAKRETDRLDNHIETQNQFNASDGWTEASVKIRLPAEKHQNVSEEAAPELEVKGLFYRNLLETIKSAVQDASASAFHWIPFQRLWKSDDDEPPIRIYDELYTSDAWLEAHEKLKAQPREPGCTLETAIVGLMMWSDSTHLTNFGSALLWPIYLFFGNQSKYERGKPTKAAAHHLAYIPSVSGSFTSGVHSFICVLLASCDLSRFLCINLWRRRNSKRSHTLQARTDARDLGASSRWQVYGGVRAWDRNSMR